MGEALERPLFHGPVALHALAQVFLKVSLAGFGGGLALTHRFVVDERGWLTEEEFTDIVSLCQFLPGPNIIGIAVCTGTRLRGGAGALAAAAGFLFIPWVLGFAAGVLFLSVRARDLWQAAAPRRAVWAGADQHCRRQPPNGPNTMSGPATLLILVPHLALLSAISFGGFPTVLPDVRQLVVVTHGWMTDQEFANLFAISQSLPGPNMILMMSFIGWKLWGFPGAVASAFTWVPRRWPRPFIRSPLAGRLRPSAKGRGPGSPRPGPR
jgi:chromate transport protein ChrA